MCARRFLLAASLVIGAYGCSDTRHPPTAPSALNMETPTVAGGPTQTMSWECGRVAANPTSTNGWTFSTPGVSCPGSRVVVQDVGVGVGQVTVAPGNFRSTVTGSTVRLDWNPVLEPVITYLIQAGSGPGLSNLASLLTGNAAASLVVGSVPAGQYSSACAESARTTFQDRRRTRSSSRSGADAPRFPGRRSG